MLDAAGAASDTNDDRNTGNLYSGAVASPRKPTKAETRAAVAATLSANANAIVRTCLIRHEAIRLAGEARAAQLSAENGRLRDRHALALASFDHKNEGTAETHDNASKIKQSPLSRMVRLGKVSADELAAAVEIAEAVQMIEGDVSMRSATLERVDNMGAGRDALVEGLKRVRMQVAYGIWRDRLPAPKRLVIDLIVAERTYVVIAKEHGIHWRTARKRLLRALQAWPGCKLEARRISREDLNEIHAELER